MDIRFSGSRSEIAPLTWGQWAIWDAMQKTAPDDHYFNFGRVLAVPKRARPLTVERAAELLGALVERHESLRTRLRTGPYPGAGPYQALEATGAIPVTVSGGDPEKLLDALAETAFDYEGEWPLRVGLVLAGGEVTHIVLVFCHLAADGLGAAIAITDLRLLLLRGSLPGPPPPSPLDLARRQESERGLKVAGAAAAYWESEYRRIPPTMFDQPADAPENPPVWRAQLVSRALELALQKVAAANTMSTSTVLLAATSALAGRAGGHDMCAMLPIVGNRFRGDTANVVTTLSQEGLFVLDLRVNSFRDLLRAARPASLRAYRSAYHDPRDRDRLTAQVSLERGTPIHPYCCFNDARLADRVDPSHDERTVRRAMDATTLTWPLSQEKLNCRFCLHVSGEPGGLGVSLTADTRFMSRKTMERYLFDLESLMVEAAFHEVLEPIG
ncbi:condensation domain-containing protein [Streptosporangium sp. 'caverna']|uniref:condensation domain-containing protein n=1 Tax=Streptosporangium sp. 'caverna' TaxID=2202249 RepID=UPI000D7DBE5D|nr:condensation domain-containing protein [Streptosporangium sp. 'caverna']AWS41454.1 non-ribosomal peptide synthetase condensation domain protein [Streptosporangium sp. 'caverna']